MQGKWKENVSIYHKDCKRRKQKRKHTIKDKAKWYLTNKEKVLNKKNLYEDVIEHKIPIVQKKEKYLPIHILFVEKYNKEYDFIDIIKVKAFQWKRGWINVDTMDYISGHVLKDIQTEDVFQLILHHESKEKERISEYGNNKIIMFNTLLPQNYWHYFGFYSHSLRKFWQKYAHRKDRMLLRNWISHRDFDEEIKTHYLSKSISWEVW